jgi:hypothetical protein
MTVQREDENPEISELKSLLIQVIEQSRDEEEGDCIFCQCELGQGHDKTECCYDGCIVTTLREKTDYWDVDF